MTARTLQSSSCVFCPPFRNNSVLCVVNVVLLSKNDDSEWDEMEAGRSFTLNCPHGLRLRSLVKVTGTPHGRVPVFRQQCRQ